MRDSQTGFTLVELIIVIAVLGVLSAYAVMKSVSPAEVTLPSQAQTVASDIRHVQTLAYTSGSRERLSVSAGTFSAVPCSSPPISCSATANFSDNLAKNVTFVSDRTVDFDTLGRPSGAASFTLTSGSSSQTVCVAALTGLVSVSSSGNCP